MPAARNSSIVRRWKCAARGSADTPRNRSTASERDAVLCQKHRRRKADEAAANNQNRRVRGIARLGHKLLPVGPQGRCYSPAAMCPQRVRVVTLTIGLQTEHLRGTQFASRAHLWQLPHHRWPTPLRYIAPAVWLTPRKSIIKFSRRGQMILTACICLVSFFCNGANLPRQSGSSIACLGDIPTIRSP